MDQIRDSFNKVKEDINSLKIEVSSLKTALFETREQIKEICGILTKIIEKQVSTDKQLNTARTTYPSTHPQEIGGLKSQNLGISTGNEGVPTDRQTDRQTDIPTQKSTKIQENSVDNALEILKTLDSIKKEIRLKFKRLTEQEWILFSAIYQLEEEHGFSDYKTLSKRLNLTESSIRDYTGRLINKGIPLEKNKINNKTIHISISPNLKKIAPLSTIMQLRDL